MAYSDWMCIRQKGRRRSGAREEETTKIMGSNLSPLTHGCNVPTLDTPAMHQLDFSEAVDHLTVQDPRYHRDAYYFVREALDQAVKLRKRQLGESGHVTGQQICEGAKQVALKQYGPMVPTVLDYWGVAKTEDIGEIVWNLIDLGVFGKTEADSRKDFQTVYSFHDAFVEPYLPGKASVPPPKKPAQTERVKQ
jgi:uncharacterized repeat protein (TIGR04138 family)